MPMNGWLYLRLMARRYRVPMEVIIEVADEQEFVERVLIRRELDNSDFRARGTCHRRVRGTDAGLN